MYISTVIILYVCIELENFINHTTTIIASTDVLCIELSS